MQLISEPQTEEVTSPNIVMNHKTVGFNQQKLGFS